MTKKAKFLCILQSADFGCFKKMKMFESKTLKLILFRYCFKNIYIMCTSTRTGVANMTFTIEQ